MLSEFGLTHDVFRASSYSSPEVCDLHLKALKQVLLDRGLVRNLRQGGWQSFFEANRPQWDQRAKELVKKLVSQNRFRGAPDARPDIPTNDAGWCLEAIASNASKPLAGIITTQATANTLPASATVSAIEKLDCCVWWNEEWQAGDVRRRTGDYLRLFTPVLEKANLLMFVDPHLDPRRPGYSEFIQLLLAAARADGCVPLIEIHRVCYEGQGPSRRVLSREQWETAFESLDAPLKQAKLTADVFIWDDFHDRFLITDLVGILMGNGFDISRASGAMTTWARLSRDVRTRVQVEFDPLNSPSRSLCARFRLGDG